MQATVGDDPRDQVPYDRWRAGVSVSDGDLQKMRATAYVLYAVKQVDSLLQQSHRATGICYLRILDTLLCTLSALGASHRTQEDARIVQNFES